MAAREEVSEIIFSLTAEGARYGRGVAGKHAGTISGRNGLEEHAEEDGACKRGGIATKVGTEVVPE